MPDEMDLPQLLESMRKTRFAMFTTVDGEGGLHARPMTTLEAGEDGSLWFFGVRDSELVGEVSAQNAVGLAYVDNGSSTYTFVSGTCHLREDRAKVDELWSRIHEAWFDGPDDPRLQLIEVRMESAEYWDSPDPGAVRILSMVRAAVTGKQPEGDHGEIEVAQPS